MSSRKRVVPYLIEMKERKKRRIERLEKIIHESENVLDLLQSLDVRKIIRWMINRKVKMILL